jgi:adenylate kinase family enzyme
MVILFHMIKLQDLGKRICIIGPSNSGKSTLAKKLSEKLNVPVAHLDQLAHVPGTNWIPRANEEWKDDHDRFIEGEHWVIDGNYSFSMPQRFTRATYVIWLDFSPVGCVMRYLFRSLKSDPDRPGRLQNATNEFSFDLVNYILFRYPKSREKAKAILDVNTVKVLRLSSIRELNHYYKLWDLPHVL